MSGIYPVFEPSLPSADGFNGKGLSGDLDELDAIAVSLGLVQLSEFIDAHTMALEVLDEEDLPADCPPVRWYSAQEGFASVDGLLRHFEQHPERLPQPTTALIADLERLAALLEEAKVQDIKFQLLVDL